MQTACLSARRLGDATLSSAPAAVDICAFPGDPFAAAIEFRDELGVPMNMTGTWTADITTADDTVLTSFTVDTTNAGTGHLTISLTPVQTALLDGAGLLAWSLVGAVGPADPRTWLLGTVSSAKLGRPSGGVDSVHIDLSTAGDTVSVSLGGTPGPPGPVGPVGPPGGAMTVYVHSEVAPNTTWTIVHNLGYFPNVNCEDNTSTQIVGELNQVDVTTLIIYFDVAVAGTAYLS